MTNITPGDSAHRRGNQTVKILILHLKNQLEWLSTHGEESDAPYEQILASIAHVTEELKFYENLPEDLSVQDALDRYWKKNAEYSSLREKR